MEFWRLRISASVTLLISSSCVHILSLVLLPLLFKATLNIMAFRSSRCRAVLQATRQSSFLPQSTPFSSPAISYMRPASVIKIQTAFVATHRPNRPFGKDEVRTTFSPSDERSDMQQIKTFVTSQPAKLEYSSYNRRIVNALDKLDKAAAKLLFCCLLGGVAVTLVRELLWPRTNLLRDKDGPITFIWWKITALWCSEESENECGFTKGQSCWTSD